MKSLFIPLICTALFSQSGGNTITIPIANSSFEDLLPYSQDPCGQIQIKPPHWYVSAGNDADVIVNKSPRPCDFSPPPDGNQMAVVLNAAISQNLGDIFALKGTGDGFYVVHFFVGNYFYWYEGHYTVSLSAVQTGPYSLGTGAVFPLCSTSGWAMGDFVDVTLVCPAQRKYGQLRITLASGPVPGGTGYQNNGYQNLFDNVSLTFTPSN